MDEDGDGAIDLAEWLSRLGSCAGLAAALDENVNADGEIAKFNAQAAEQAAAEAAAAAPAIETWGKSVFEQFDTDHNGKLTPQELTAALKSLPRKKPKTIPPGAKFMSLDEMISAMDEDGDGAIDLAEWLSRLGSCAGLAAALDENVNADGEIAKFNDQQAAA